MDRNRYFSGMVMFMRLTVQTDLLDHRNLSSVIEDTINSNLHEKVKEWFLTWQLFVIFNALDNYPVFFSPSTLPFIGSILSLFNLSSCIEWGVTHFVLRIASLFGWVLGLRGSYAEYTPNLTLKGKGKGKGEEKERLCGLHETGELEELLDRADRM